MAQQEFRDRDIRNAMRDACEATGLFDLATTGGLPEVNGGDSGQTAVIVIEPLNYIDSDPADEDFGPLLVRTGTARVTVLAIDQDGATRDELAEKLCHLASNACNGASLAGLTYPDKTRFTTWRWLKPSPPERRVEGTFTYQYEVGSFTDLGTAE